MDVTDCQGSIGDDLRVSGLALKMSLAVWDCWELACITITYRHHCIKNFVAPKTVYMFRLISSV
jgi:hypothetical protein